MPHILKGDTLERIWLLLEWTETTRSYQLPLVFVKVRATKHGLGLCIGEVKGLSIISDRHLAIAHACSTVFPNAFHGYCCRHLMMNCNLKSKKWRAIYWRTCKLYTEREFDDSISEIRASKPLVYKKLEDAGWGRWSRAYCPANRYNYLTSNSVESVNSLSTSPLLVLI